MAVSTVGFVAPTPNTTVGVLALSSASNATSDKSAAPSAAIPVDTITISEQAQLALTSGTAVAQGSVGSTSNSVIQAISVLNDTSSGASVEAQLAAYKLIAQYVSDSQGNSVTSNEQTVMALYDAPFSQHAQQIFTELQSQMNWDGGDATANSIDTVLKSFDALSETDQQIYVGAVGLQNQLVSREVPITSISDFKANLEARAAVEHALQTAESDPKYASAIGEGVGKDFYSKRDDMAALAAASGDQAIVDLAKLSNTSQSNTVDWTQQVQAYFAKYGPPAQLRQSSESSPSVTPNRAPVGYQAPNGATLGADLAAINDASGKTSLNDRLAAFQTLSDYLRFSSDYGPARTALSKALSASPFSAYAAKLQDTIAGGLALPGKDAASDALSRLNALSANDQQAYFSISNVDNNGAQRFASLDNLKANYAARSAVQSLENSLLTRYGVDSLTQITDPSLTKTSGFRGLLRLFSSSDWQYDAWTQNAQRVLADFKSISLNPLAIVTNSAVPTLKAFAISAVDGNTVGLQLLTSAAASQAKAEPVTGGSHTPTTPRQAAYSPGSVHRITV